MRPSSSIWAASLLALSYLGAVSAGPSRMRRTDSTATGTSTAAVTTTTQTVAAAPTLYPAVKSHANASNVAVLTPAKKGSLLYTEGGTTLDTTTLSAFATANVTYLHPAVNLGDSNLISNIACTSTGISITFNSTSAYQHTKAQWSVNGGFLLIARSLHCDSSETGDNGYWSVTHLAFTDGTRNIAVTATEVTMAEAFPEIDLVWGYVNPANTAASVFSANAGTNSTVVSTDASSKRSTDTTVSSTVSLEVAYSDPEDTPWGTGDGHLLYSYMDKLEVYCVDCGLHGSVTLGGHIYIAYFSPNYMTINLDGHLDAGLNIGVLSHGAYDKKWNKQLINLSLPGAGIDIVGVIHAGVSVNVNAVGELAISAEGQLLVGAEFSADLHAQLGIYQAGNSFSFTPTLTKTFNASAALSANASIALPMEIAVHLEVPVLSLFSSSGTWDVGLRNTPTLNAGVTVNLNTDATAAAEATCGNGIGYHLDFENSVDFDYNGGLTNLADWKQPNIFSGCYQLPTASSSSSASSSASSATDSASSSASSSSFSSAVTSTATGSTASSAASTSSSASTSITPVVHVHSTKQTTSASSSASSAAATYAYATDSPSQLPTYEWSEYAGFKWVGATSTIVATAKTATTCAQACYSAGSCLVAVYKSGVCTLGSGSITSVAAATGYTSYGMQKCSAMASQAGTSASSCSRFIIAAF